MTAFIPIFRSPLDALSAPSNLGVQLYDLSGVQVTLVQGVVADLLQTFFGNIPDKSGDLVDVGGGLLARLTATQFYLFGMSPSSQLPSVAMLEGRFKQANRFAHATDYSGGTALLRLVGYSAPEALSKICGLDFHTNAFPNLHVAQTSAVKIKTMIARHDQGDIPGYYLHVDAPSARYFWSTLLIEVHHQNQAMIAK